MIIEERLKKILLRVGELQTQVAELRRENETLRKANKFLKLEAEQGESARVETAYTPVAEDCGISKSELAAVKKDIQAYIAEIDKSIHWLKTL